LVNENGFSIHHVASHALICPVAFILRECAGDMVNRRFERDVTRIAASSRVNLTLNRFCLKEPSEAVGMNSCRLVGSVFVSKKP
jgi:hypothetical protein